MSDPTPEAPDPATVTPTATATPTVTVTVADGTLRGHVLGGTRRFRGVRYATAARCEPPVDTPAWEGTVDALSFGPQAPQNAGALEKMLGSSDADTGEDCLVLNVWTPVPDSSTGSGRRPVLVWIHGGAYVTGSGSMPWYDGTALVERGDVVVVTINYRLGALGFLGGSDLGTLDMISALRWVNRNVEALGGDPQNVTIVGESAGGSAVVSLFAAPGADGLFHRGWAMSPSILQLRTMHEADELTARFLDLLGVESTDDVRTAELADVLAAQTRMPVAAGLKNFSPTDGTEVIPEPILDTAAHDPRPLVIGTNRDELLLFTAFDPARSGWGDEDVRREFGRRFDDAPAAIEAYRRRRPDAVGDASRLVSSMQTDEMFRIPAVRLADARAEAGHDTWVYEFHQTTPAFGGRLGSCHGLDIPFAFHNLDRQGAAMFTGGSDDLVPVADDFADALLAFAHHGDPAWARFDTDTRPTRIIGPEPRTVHDPEPDLRRLWG